MKTCNKLYAIVEVDGDGERFFNGLLRAGDYNKNYKLAVYKYKKTAENRLDEIQREYQDWLDKPEGYFYRRNYRIIGELIIKEFTA